MKIGIIGLGYVGLPLAVSLARHFSVLGFDINKSRIADLKKGHDITEEVSEEDLKASSFQPTHKIDDLKDVTHYIVTVPTPITPDKRPDLSLLKTASEMIAPLLNKGDVVIYESTVYPGVTEDFCGPVLETGSNLLCGKDFFLGYSPERMNPGDKQHTVEKITKVVAGQNPDVTERLAFIYGKITSIHKATSIKTAEAAKVIENTQRDINIAFMNEITQIFQKGGISIHEVLESARTKWNFLPFTPGLVGGHCIGVDPYYLADYAQQLKVDPQLILGGRSINDKMSTFYADLLHQSFSDARPRKLVVFGITFKENIPDTRNSKAVDLVHELKKRQHEIYVIDPHACADEVLKTYKIKLSTWDDLPKGLDGGIVAVPHREFLTFSEEDLSCKFRENGTFLDIHHIWKPRFKKQKFKFVPH